MTYKENITAILECNFPGFKDDIINNACNRILEQEPKKEIDTLQAIINYCDNRTRCYGCKYINHETVRCRLVGVPSEWELD